MKQIVQLRQCMYCKGRMMPVKGFFEQIEEGRYKKMKRAFQEEFGFELRDSGYQNCIMCGQVYDQSGEVLQFKLGWLLA